MKRAITVMGAAGSGKSTVAKMVAGRLGWHYVSTGDIARGLIDGEWQALGLMAPEAEMREAFEQEVAEHEYVVLDGMPRKPEQVDYLDIMFDDVQYFVIKISNQDAITRLLKRGRTDDTEGAIIQRLNDYQRTTEKAIAKAKRRHVVVSVDGLMPAESSAAFIAEYSR